MSSIPQTDTERKTTLTIAQHYHGLGFNLVPTGADKKPVMVKGKRHEWDNWQTTRQTPPDLAGMPWQGGIAAICGPVSDNLVCLDFDGVTDRTPVREALDALGLGADYPWVVKTLRGGCHIWLRCPGLALDGGKGHLDRPGVEGCDHVELRYTGHYAILPPSNKGAYAFLQGHTPNTPPAIVTPALLLTAYDLVTVKKTTSTAPAVAPMTGATGNGYAQKALRDELGILAMAQDGNRNKQLNRSAFSLGQLVGAGYLDRTEVESRLRAVALAIGLGEAETKGTIKSGIEDGIKEPRIVPQRNGAHGAPDFAPPPRDYLDDDAPSDDDLVEAPPVKLTTGKAAQPWLLTEGADDDGNAACVMHAYGAQFLYCDAYGWLAWNGRYWQREHAEATLDGVIVNVLKQRRRAAVEAEKEAVVKAAQPSAKRVRDAKYLFRSRVVATVASFDANPDLLNCNNGVVDLRTGTLVPHNPGLRFTTCLTVDYDPQADCTQWVNFLRGAVVDDDTLTYLQQASGYSLTGHTSEECLFYVFGPPRSGKGTYTETKLALLSPPLGRGADFSTFTAKRDDPNNFDLATLKPARLVVASESNRYHELNAARIKTLTGGDHISCALKYHDHFSYRPQFKIWLVSNHPVNVAVDDDAAWYRLRVIEFPHSHAGSEDKGLKLRMKSPANLRGVLRWAVEGARAWYASPTGLVTPKAVMLATTAQREALDYTQSWIDECCVVSPGAWTSNELLYQSYASWCKDNGVTPRAQRGLSVALRSKGYTTGVQRKDANTNRKGVEGLGLTTMGTQ